MDYILSALREKAHYDGLAKQATVVPALAKLSLLEQMKAKTLTKND